MLVAAFLIAFAPPPDTAVARDLTVAPGEVLRVTSRGSGPVVVLIPGLFGSAYGYRKVTEPLARAGLRTIVIEPLGTGWSSQPAGADYSLTAQADRIGRALDQLNVRGAVVVAHSVGASMALRLAVRRPELVRGIVSIDGGPAETAATPGLTDATRYASVMKFFVDAGAIRKQVRAGMIKNSGDTSWVTDAAVAAYTAGFARDVRAGIDALKGMADSHESEPLRPSLPRIRIPVRLLIGDAPHATRTPDEEIVILSAGLHDFAVEHVPRAGQYIQEEQPDAVVATVRRLARR
ncbi:MAG: alpha/beta fold hydrolase [Gemmatimonadota bacterium]